MEFLGCYRRLEIRRRRRDLDFAIRGPRRRRHGHQDRSAAAALKTKSSARRASTSWNRPAYSVLLRPEALRSCRRSGPRRRPRTPRREPRAKVAAALLPLGRIVRSSALHHFASPPQSSLTSAVIQVNSTISLT
jgi:hypothetical protein